MASTGQTLYAELKAVDAIAQVMRRTGCAWDFEAAKRLEGEYSEKLEKVEAQIKRATEGLGIPAFNPGSPKQVADLYQRCFKVEPVKWNKPNEKGVASPSYDEDALTEYLKSDNPACVEFSGKLLEWRGYAKMLGTYIRGMAPAPGADRVYGEWRAHTAISGRWSCTGVPLQTLSGEMRQLIRASPLKRIVEADLAAAELRTVALFANETKMLQAFAEGADLYSRLAQDMFGDPTIKKGHKLRQLGKLVILASNYGASPDTVWAQVVKDPTVQKEFPSLSVRQVLAIQNKYFASCPRIKEWWREEESACRKRGFYFEPLSGRRVKFFGEPNLNLLTNFPNQACVAWWMNRALLRVWAELRPEDVVLTVVHDAITVESPEPERVQALLHQHMGGVLTYAGRSVEMPVESKIGDTLDAVK